MVRPDFIQNKEAFERYKRRLDERELKDLSHEGEPESYPCGVMSEYVPAWAGAIYDHPAHWKHTFIYDPEDFY